MNRRALLASVWLLAAACGPGGMNQGDAGADAARTTDLFMGRYTATTDVSAAQAEVAAIAAAGERADMNQWDMVDAALAAGQPAGTLLGRVDMEFVADPATSPYAIATTVRRGVTLGRAAQSDAQFDVAHETVGKPLTVALGLAVQSELRLAVAELAAARAESARQHWDRAAMYFSGIEPGIREYQNQMIPGLWGPMRDALSTDDLSGTLIDLLRRGRGAIDAGAQRTVREIAEQTGAYLTRIFLLTGVKYAAIIENAVTAMTEIDPGAQPEGTYGFEGVFLPYLGRAPMPAVDAARMRWRAEANTIRRAAVVRDAAVLYGQINAAGLEAYMTATDDARFATIARMVGTVAALREALVSAGQDPAALQTQLAQARMRSEAGDHAAARATLGMVQDAVTRLGVTSMGM